MSQQDITPREALMRLGASTAEAIANVLEMFVSGAVERGEVTVSVDGASPFTNLPIGGVAASVSYINGVTGANVLVMSRAGARALAAAMGVPAPEGEELATDLSELELSAVGEAANQSLAAAAAAISVVLGQEVEISPPEVRVLERGDIGANLFGTAPHAITTTFVIAGEACRLIQLVPSAFVVRMARAIDEMSIDQPGANDAAGRAAAGGELGGPDGDGAVSLTDALRDINLRVWAELGRTRLALGQALELPVGAVVDLDRAADAPVDLFVNGLCFGHGHLLVTDDGEWAICVDALSGSPTRVGALVATPTQ
jgi:flagellar motor switch protein FliN/FliY